MLQNISLNTELIQQCCFPLKLNINVLAEKKCTLLTAVNCGCCVNEILKADASKTRRVINAFIWLIKMKVNF